VVKKAPRFIRENNKQDYKKALPSQIKACNELIKSSKQKLPVSVMTSEAVALWTTPYF
jgi:hypothetical protein